MTNIYRAILRSAFAQRARRAYRLSPRQCIPVASRNWDRILPESDRIVESG
ncbi:hypothetical protein [Limnospira platensis]|uniref:hypothetical protein n=1 Tax=Limnospira platensis TaxID=118562 RepID=UPI001561CCA7|nr:hypothetical protein [Arthrospira platensis]